MKNSSETEALIVSEAPAVTPRPIGRAATRVLAASLFAVISIAVPSTAYAGCTLYQHRDYGGARYGLDGGDGMRMVRGETICTAVSHGPGGGCTYSEPSWNDQVSSFRVTNGCTLTLWQHIDKRGARFRSDRSYKYVGSSWNDEASEASCSCR
jgi:syncollin